MRACRAGPCASSARRAAARSRRRGRSSRRRARPCAARAPPSNSPRPPPTRPRETVRREPAGTRAGWRRVRPPAGRAAGLLPAASRDRGASHGVRAVRSAALSSPPPRLPEAHRTCCRACPPTIVRATARHSLHLTSWDRTSVARNTLPPIPVARRDCRGGDAGAVREPEAAPALAGRGGARRTPHPRPLPQGEREPDRLDARDARRRSPYARPRGSPDAARRRAARRRRWRCLR